MGKYDQERLESLSEDNISRLVGHSRFYISGWIDLHIVELSSYTISSFIYSALVTVGSYLQDLKIIIIILKNELC